MKTFLRFFTGAGISATKGSPAKSGWSGGGMLQFLFCILYLYSAFYICMCICMLEFSGNVVFVFVFCILYLYLHAEI